ncbi:hypothetical protein Cantr_04121 [Candida viswanathii]|uniref:Nucleoporin Nup133/Nup155-like N-terminal domain-containing protein n=1 Tax=Candida viswanathii TaxID=5486 RepID=A0A367XQD4_9ASCO|nr:hypothetical protein Cantr_04121 [Candida viswanathii]
MSIFKPRSGLTKQPSTTTTTTTSTTSTTHELTKNEHYCVSSLPALPSVFKTQSSTFSNAYSDSESKYSLVINATLIYVWSYKSTDATPLSIEFPIDAAKFQLPMAILTRPASGTGQDPGLVMLDSVSGLVKFYESVQHAPTLGLINDKSLEVKLPLRKGEYVMLAENVEPAGIVVATSLRRCLVVSLRDFKSKPLLGCVELLNNEGFFLRLLFRAESDGGGALRNDEIVAIRSGKVSNHGTSQEIVVLDSAGGFHLYTYNLFSANGSPYVDKKKSFKQYISIDSNEYPGMLQQEAEFLDVWPIDNESHYLALTQIQGDLYLITLKIDKSGSLPIGSHKLKTAPSSSTNKPKLYLPHPQKTAFVIIDNSVILTDLNTSYIKDASKKLNYYKPRWEDIIRFKSAVELIGSGYENQSANSNPAVILITKNFGVIRVEKFPESQTDEVMDPLAVVKSHIEQAIFYSDIQEIDFDLTQRFESETITKAIQLIIEEVLNSTSPYLPKTLPSISDLTSLKVKLYKKLIEYVERNGFNKNIIPPIVENLEKSEVAFQMWNIIDQDNSLKKVLLSQIPDVRDFFTHKVSDINQILTNFVETLMQQNLPVLQLIVNTLYQGIYLNDIHYIYNDLAKSWIFESNLIMRAEEIFIREFVKSDNNKQEDALKLVEVLYYFVNEAITYMKATAGDDDDSNMQLRDYQGWYNKQKSDWIGVLLKFDLVQNATEIAEKYNDFASLARILDTEKTNKKIPLDQLDYAKYFEKFGYAFASCVYDHYLDTDDIHSLLLDFINYKPYLLRYFQENPQKTSSVSWIRNLLDSQFNLASNALIVSAQESKPTGDLHNQHIKYSISKLSAIAANNEDNLNDVNAELLIIKYQRLVRGALSETGRVEAIQKDTFIKSYVNPDIRREFVNAVVDQYYDKLTKNVQLSAGEIVNLLTSLKSSILDKQSFGYAYKVAQSILNQSVGNYYASLVLVRLLTIGDDAEVYSQANDVSDQQRKQKATESALYKTLKQDVGAISKLEQVLADPAGAIDDEYEDDLELRLFNEVLVSELVEKLKDGKFKNWVESVKEQARL